MSQLPCLGEGRLLQTTHNSLELSSAWAVRESLSSCLRAHNGSCSFALGMTLSAGPLWAAQLPAVTASPSGHMGPEATLHTGAWGRVVGMAVSQLLAWM